MPPTQEDLAGLQSGRIDPKLFEEGQAEGAEIWSRYYSGLKEKLGREPGPDSGTGNLTLEQLREFPDLHKAVPMALRIRKMITLTKKKLSQDHYLPTGWDLDQVHQPPFHDELVQPLIDSGNWRGRGGSFRNDLCMEHYGTHY